MKSGPVPNLHQVPTAALPRCRYILPRSEQRMSTHWGSHSALLTAQTIRITLDTEQ